MFQDIPHPDGFEASGKRDFLGIKIGALYSAGADETTSLVDCEWRDIYSVRVVSPVEKRFRVHTEGTPAI
jgi:hypothetical protein